MEKQKQQQMQKADGNKYEDCFSCKIVGAGAFGGLGIYALREASKLQKIAGKQNSAVAVGVAGVSIYRLTM
ncbi:hypothetical protein BX666DRAFT_1630913 [Dichotomocladium elegans]|nr:hypothetical protein BX666DRAFT_1630913 [Dichotomocladium elegans]